MALYVVWLSIYLCIYVTEHWQWHLVIKPGTLIHYEMFKKQWFMKIYLFYHQVIDFELKCFLTMPLDMISFTTFFSCFFFNCCVHLWTEKCWNEDRSVNVECSMPPTMWEINRLSRTNCAFIQAYLKNNNNLHVDNKQIKMGFSAKNIINQAKK